MVKKGLNFLVILALLWAIIFTINKANSLPKNLKNVEAAPQVNFKIPSFSLTGIDSKNYSTDNLQRPLVINFWASWCGPCRIEAPELVSLNKKFHNKVEIYAINLTSSDTESDARAFAKEYGFDFPVLLDKNGQVANLYNVTAIPTTYFISRDGIIVDRIIGFGGKDVLKSKFQKLVNIEE